MAEAIKTFTYTAHDIHNQLTSGEYSSSSETGVVNYLLGLGLKPVAITEKKKSVFDTEITFFDSISPSEVYNYTRQLAVMLKAGVPLIDALQSMESEHNNPALNRIIKEVVKDVSNGMAFSDALKKHPKAFNNMFVFIVKAGEEAGVMDRVLMKIAEFIKHDLEMRDGIKSALRYPAIVMMITLGVAVLAVVYLLPRFTSLFTDTRIELPLVTRIYLGIDHLIQNYYGFILGGLGVIGYLFYRWINTQSGRHIWDRFLLNVPIIGPINRGLAISRFSNILQTLNSSGVPILTCLNIVGKTVNNAFVQSRLDNISDEVRMGNKVAKSLRSHTGDIFPAHVLKMIEVGENAGAIDEMLEEIARLYDNETRNKVQRLTASVEPFITVTMGLFILSLALAIFVPVWDSYVALSTK